jgi:hypothetical protein
MSQGEVRLVRGQGGGQSAQVSTDCFGSGGTLLVGSRNVVPCKQACLHLLFNPNTTQHDARTHARQAGDLAGARSAAAAALAQFSGDALAAAVKAAVINRAALFRGKATTPAPPPPPAPNSAPKWPSEPFVPIWVCRESSSTAQLR